MRTPRRTEGQKCKRSKCLVQVQDEVLSLLRNSELQELEEPFSCLSTVVLGLFLFVIECNLVCSSKYFARYSICSRLFYMLLLCA